MRAQISRLERWALGLVLWAMTCTSCGHSDPVIPLNIARINPAPVWQVWGQRAIDCARALGERDSTHSFRIVHESVHVDSLVWIAVFTEQADGGFPCKSRQTNKPISCDGQFRDPDSLLISAQRLNAQPVIAHEVMHWAIQSPGEDYDQHGPPWGICEFY